MFVCCGDSWDFVFGQRLLAVLELVLHEGKAVSLLLLPVCLPADTAPTVFGRACCGSCNCSCSGLRNGIFDAGIGEGSVLQCGPCAHDGHRQNPPLLALSPASSMLCCCNCACSMSLRGCVAQMMCRTPLRMRVQPKQRPSNTGKQRMINTSACLSKSVHKAPASRQAHGPTVHAA